MGIILCVLFFSESNCMCTVNYTDNRVMYLKLEGDFLKASVTSLNVPDPN